MSSNPEPFGVILGEPEQSDLKRESGASPNTNAVSGTESGNDGVKSETASPFGFPVYEPDTASVTATPIGGRKRGRPPGSGRKPIGATGAGPEKKTASAVNLESILANVHCAIAGLTAIKELQTEKGDEDLRAYSDALKELTDMYPMQLNVKAVAWVNLFTAMGSFYGTRYTAYQLRTAEERSAKVRQMPAGNTQAPAAAPKKAAPGAKPNGAAAPHGLVIPDGTSPHDLWPAGAEDFPMNG